MELDEKRAVGHDEVRDSKHVDLKGVPEQKIKLYGMSTKKDEEWRRDATKKLPRR